MHMLVLVVLTFNNVLMLFSIFFILTKRILFALTAITFRGEPEGLSYQSHTCNICHSLPCWHWGSSVAICAFLVEGWYILLLYIQTTLLSKVNCHFFFLLYIFILLLILYSSSSGCSWIYSKH